GIMRGERQPSTADLEQDNAPPIGDEGPHRPPVGPEPAEVAVCTAVAEDPPAEGAAANVGYCAAEARGRGGPTPHLQRTVAYVVGARLDASHPREQHDEKDPEHDEQEPRPTRAEGSDGRAGDDRRSC